jgi:long-chain acyl-CoA synthetase
MFIDFLAAVFREHVDKEAMVWRDQSYTYQWLLERIDSWGQRIQVEPGTVAILEADFSPNAVALFLALLERGCITVPLTGAGGAKKPECIETAQGEVIFGLDGSDNVTIVRRDCRATHELYHILRQRRHPGLVLFSSGSTGKSKGTVHDLSSLLGKFKTRRHDLRTLAFLRFDHIGGIDTLLYSLSNGSCLITVEDRSPDSICRAVEKYRVEVLPVSPTFLNLLLLSRAYADYDLSSLKHIAYGAEVMPESTLKRCAAVFPHVNIVQKYGTTEVGALRSKSKSSDSTWVKIGGEGYHTRIVDGILQIKADSAMLGYLNAPSPFTEDGWFNTGDAVEVDGEYIRILGRKSEMINVGGEKVYPTDVEDVIHELDNVADVTVYGEPHPLTGNIVCAKVTLLTDEPERAFTSRLKHHCRARLQGYKVPVKVFVVQDRLHGERFKKVRRVDRS